MARKNERQYFASDKRRPFPSSDVWSCRLYKAKVRESLYSVFPDLVSIEVSRPSMNMSESNSIDTEIEDE